MSTPNPISWIAFGGRKRLAAGDPRTVVTAVKQLVDTDPLASVAIFDAVSSESVEVDLRGSVAAVCKRLPPPPAAVTPADTPSPAETPRGPGRPRLGVVAREVTLLPRHWDWLAAQSGGASVALRKLVERAQRASAESDRLRAAAESAYRFMHALAGDEAGFEEASRALFAGDLERLRTQVDRWPRDVRLHLLELAGRAMPAVPADAAPAPP
ncbi:MAG: DUF2239 family protein [Betaproteobacteria bacterium]